MVFNNKMLYTVYVIYFINTILKLLLVCVVYCILNCLAGCVNRCNIGTGFPQNGVSLWIGPHHQSLIKIMNRAGNEISLESTVWGERDKICEIQFTVLYTHFTGIQY